MNREDIIRMAREAGLPLAWISEKGVIQWGQLASFAALIAAAEREACAQVAESTVCDTHLPNGVQIYGGRVAKAIRARSKT